MKRGFGANSEEVKLIEDRGYRMNLTTPVDTRINNVRPLCPLAFSMLCWVFVRASFLPDPKNWDFSADCT